LFVVVDPIGGVPLFIALTCKVEMPLKRKIFRQAIYAAFLLLLVFALAGRLLLAVFNITLESFLIAAGILLLILSIQILIRGISVQDVEDASTTGVVPIAFPLLVGPGAIATTMLTLQNSGIIIALLSVGIVFFLTWVVLRLIEPINRLLGKSGSLFISKVMAVFLAAIAVEYLVTGIKHYF
jgi:multiple antibiotic resistance protein